MRSPHLRVSLGNGWSGGPGGVGRAGRGEPRERELAVCVGLCLGEQLFLLIGLAWSFNSAWPGIVAPDPKKAQKQDPDWGAGLTGAGKDPQGRVPREGDSEAVSLSLLPQPDVPFPPCLPCSLTRASAFRGCLLSFPCCSSTAPTRLPARHWGSPGSFLGLSPTSSPESHIISL